MSKSRKNTSRRQKKETRQLVMNLLIFLWFNIRVLIDTIIDCIFGWFYSGKEVKIPAVSKNYLVESATSIAASIRDKKRTSEEVVRAYIERIKEVNGIINAVTDERFDKAIQEAQQIDEDIKSGKLTEENFKNKPFLGVPFTTKESTACLGLRYTFGMMSRKDIRAKEDADVVKLIKNAGGVLIANTNIPEFNLWQEASNNVYGQTSNPYNTTRTTGGSSGGEAALIAACGTAFGIGTDIGGSIRMPAFFCGIFGHKPTSYLISTKGLTKRTGQEKHTMVVPGPMCRHAEDLTPLLKILVGKNAGKLRLDAPVNIQNLRFYYVEDSLDRRSSSVGTELRQLMTTTVNHFIDELADDTEEKIVCLTDLDELAYSYRLWRYWMTQEPLKFPLEIGNGRTVNVWSELMKKLIGKSEFTLAAILKLADDVVLPKENEKWALELTTKLRTKLLTLLDKNGVLLYPSYTWPASYHYTAFLRPFNFSYWCIFNVLQFPVTQVPMGLSKDGLPIGIQVVAAPYNDHLCIAVAKHLEQIFGGYKPPFQ